MLVKWLLLWLHPFYVSVTDISHNPANRALEISIRIFTDDFEKALQSKFPQEKIDLMNPRDKAGTDTLISRYIKEKVKISVGGKTYGMAYIGFERLEESLWCYFEINEVASPSHIHISNRLLYETHKEQTNMHHVKVGGKEKSRKLDNPETEVDFQF